MSQTVGLSLILLPAMIPFAAAAGMCVAGKICINKLIDFSINPPQLSDLGSIRTRCSELEEAYRRNLAELSSSRLSRLAEGGLHDAQRDSLSALYKAVNQTPLYKAAADGRHPGGLESIGRRLETISDYDLGLKSHNSLDAIKHDIISLASEAEITLQKVETETTHEVISTAMANLGYEQGQAGGKVRFAKGREVIFVEMGGGRTLALEAAGFVGNSCGAAMREVQAELNRLGLATRVLSVRPHQAVRDSIQQRQPVHFFNEMLCKNLDQIQQRTKPNRIKVKGD